MYTVTVERAFVAQHFLTVPDPGPEGDLHSHRYGATLELAGDSLDEHGYLVDVDAVRDRVDETVARYADATINDLPEFEGLNPSLEHFARILGEQFWSGLDAPGGGFDTPGEGLDAPQVERLTVRLTEDDVASASHERRVA